VVLDLLDSSFYDALARDAFDDLVLGATLEHRELPTEHLSLGFPSFVWGGQAWASVDGTFSTIRSVLDSEPGGGSVAFSNLSQEWTTRLNKNRENLNGVLFSIYLMFLSIEPGEGQDANAFRIREGPWTISGGTMNDSAAEFEFTTAFDALKFQVSALLARSRRCQFAYKGKFCKSESPLPSCPFTVDGCTERHVILRFSSWPFSDTRVI